MQNVLPLEAGGRSEKKRVSCRGIWYKQGFACWACCVSSYSTYHEDFHLQSSFQSGSRVILPSGPVLLL
jgi:hypothetical protein